MKKTAKKTTARNKAKKKVSPKISTTHKKAATKRASLAKKKVVRKKIAAKKPASTKKKTSQKKTTNKKASAGNKKATPKKNTASSKKPTKTSKENAAKTKCAAIPDIGKTKLSNNAGIMTLDFLEKSWPVNATPEIKNAFAMLKNALGDDPVTTTVGAKATTEEASWPPTENVDRHFDIMGLIRHVLSSHDMLFLSRQVTYHISASADIPKVWAEREHIGEVFSKLIEHMARRASRSSRIGIEIKGVALHNGPGVEIKCTGTDRLLDETAGKDFISAIFHGEDAKGDSRTLAECRGLVLKQRGQLWVDILKPHYPAYNIVLPANEQAAGPHPTEHRTYKYDISITNYANVRKRFGIKKSLFLVERIEHYVKSLVRYPIDMVMALGDKGMITTIYETQQGTAESVASRISKRLGREEFRIGKRPVDLMFRYDLSLLNSHHTSLAREKNNGNG